MADESMTKRKRKRAEDYSSFDDNVQHCKNFYEAFGDLPKRIGDNGMESYLACFLSHGREEKKKGKLSAGRIEALESIPNFAWDPLLNVVEEKIAKIKEFVATFGELPRRNKQDNSEPSRLAAFLHNKRQEKKKGKLSSDCIEALESIPGFQWDVNSTNFNDSVLRIRSFIAKYGCIPKRRQSTQHDEDEFRLASFLQHRRQDKKKGILSPECVSALESLPGFEWTIKAVCSFEDNVKAILAFHTEFGDVPKLYGTRDGHKEHQLAVFLLRKKCALKKGQLTAEKIAMLSEVIALKSQSRLTNAFEEDVSSVTKFVESFGKTPCALY